MEWDVLLLFQDDWPFKGYSNMAASDKLERAQVDLTKNKLPKNTVRLVMYNLYLCKLVDKRGDILWRASAATGAWTSAHSRSSAWILVTTLFFRFHSPSLSQAELCRRQGLDLTHWLWKPQQLFYLLYSQRWPQVRGKVKGYALSLYRTNVRKSDSSAPDEQHPM